MSVKSINRALVDRGYPEVQIERGKGYIYFIYDDRGPNYDTHSIMVPYLNVYTDDEWIEQGVEYAEGMRAKIAENAEMGEGSPFRRGAGTFLYLRPYYTAIIQGKPYGDRKDSLEAAQRLAMMTGSFSCGVVRTFDGTNTLVWLFDRKRNIHGPVNEPFTGDL